MHGYMISKPHSNHAKFQSAFTETGHNNAFVIVNKIAINTVYLILSLEPLNFFRIWAGLFPGPILLSLWFGEIMNKANLDLKRRNWSLLINHLFRTTWNDWHN